MHFTEVLSHAITFYVTFKMALVVKSSRILLKDKIHSGCIEVLNGKIKAIKDHFDANNYNNCKVCCVLSCISLLTYALTRTVNTLYFFPLFYLHYFSESIINQLYFNISVQLSSILLF